MCPECGAPITVSLAGDALQFADPTWLRKVELGIFVQLWTLGGAFFLLGIAHWVLSWIVPSVADLLSAIVLVLLCLLVFAGIWLASSPNPSMQPSERWCAPRRLVRVAIVICAFSCLVSITLFAVMGSVTLGLGVLFLGGPFGAVSLVGTYGLCRHVEMVASAQTMRLRFNAAARTCVGMQSAGVA